jgi:2-dehydropantoate 2-reductase
MRVGVIGPGALGCLVAARLSKIADVFIIDKTSERANYLNKSGIIVDNKRFEIPVVHDLKGIKCGLCVVTVKSYDTARVIKQVRSVVSPESYVLTLQNGVGNSELLLKHLNARVVGGVTCEASTLNSKGAVTHMGRGDTLLKGINHNNISEVVELFDSAGFLVKEVDDYYKARWRKLIINSGINPVSVLTGKKNGKLIGNQLMYKLAREAHHVGLLKGFSFDFDNPNKVLDAVCSDTANNKSSMLQDFERGKQTEIAYLNGVVVREARKHFHPVSNNAWVVNRIAELTKNV